MFQSSLQYLEYQINDNKEICLVKMNHSPQDMWGHLNPLRSILNSPTHEIPKARQHEK
jgi:hypothetical protein